MRSYGRQNSRGESIKTIIEMTVMIEAGTGLVRGHLAETIATIEVGVQATVGPGQDLEHVQTGIG